MVALRLAKNALGLLLLAAGLACADRPNTPPAESDPGKLKADYATDQHSRTQRVAVVQHMLADPRH